MEVDTGMALFSMFLVVWVIVFAIFAICWVFVSWQAMKFCRTCGHPTPGFVWIPLAGVPQMTVLQAMDILGASTLNYQMLTYLGWGVSIGVLCAPIPVVGWILGAVASLGIIALFFLHLWGIYKTAQMVGANGVLLIILCLLIQPIGSGISYMILNKRVMAYAEETYG